MPRPDRVLFVCTNVRPPDGKESCGGHNGSAELAAALRREVKERGLKGPLRVSTTSCLGPCDGGAHAVVIPENTWYAGLTAADAPELVDHLAAGTVLERRRAPEPTPPADPASGAGEGGR